jgi:lipopolysaccharide/colanic/teichoic acid biosynthesis glycosyltransferase
MTSRAGSGVAKRAFDLALGSILALASLPVMAAVAVAIRITAGPPVIFAGIRPGKSGKPFLMRKFRTMRDSLDEHGKPLPDEQRLTRLGRFLRSSSLDELPQLFNVLRGDMSLVGPRPLLMEYLDRYTPEQARRHDVKPGITGWQQVNGRNAMSWEQKFAFDVWYVDNASLALDLKILWLTVVKVVKREGISAAGHATMPEFRGAGEP